MPNLIKRLPLFLGIACSLLPALSRAQSVWVEDFSGYPLNKPPLAGPSEKWTSATDDENSDVETRVETDSRGIFGGPKDNQILRISDLSTSNNKLIMVASESFKVGDQGFLKLRFAEPIEALYQGRGFVLRLNNKPGNASTAFAISIQGGRLVECDGPNVEPGSKTVAPYDLDKVHSLALVWNNDEAPAPYAGGSVAARSMDVWLDGVKAGTVPAAGGLPSGQFVRGFDFTSKPNPDPKRDFAGTLLIDDIQFGPIEAYSSSAKQ